MGIGLVELLLFTFAVAIYFAVKRLTSKAKQ